MTANTVRASGVMSCRRAKAELEAEASGVQQRSKQAARRSRGARKRADDAQKLAIETALAAGLIQSISTSWALAVASPSPEVP